jgi:hypothetical protein
MTKFDEWRTRYVRRQASPGAPVRTLEDENSWQDTAAGDTVTARCRPRPLSLIEPPQDVLRWTRAAAACYAPDQALGRACGHGNIRL